LRTSPGVLVSKDGEEELVRCQSVSLGLRQVHLVNHALGLRLQLLRKLVENVGGLVNPAALAAALTVAAFHGNEFLAAILGRFHYHQSAQLVLVDPHVEVDAVNPDIYRLFSAEITAITLLVLVSSASRQPAHTGTRQIAGTRPEEFS